MAKKRESKAMRLLREKLRYRQQRVRIDIRGLETSIASAKRVGKQMRDLQQKEMKK